jgi:hypothetical protein
VLDTSGEIRLPPAMVGLLCLGGARGDVAKMMNRVICYIGKELVTVTFELYLL